mmetsp:Transcript_4914/g.14208  ORF Transcript_4914/g.14208 Transcript_4914/m.14208 type:complete len:291 (-) Transcript_4914:123-995(-)
MSRRRSPGRWNQATSQVAAQRRRSAQQIPRRGTPQSAASGGRRRSTKGRRVLRCWGGFVVGLVIVGIAVFSHTRGGRRSVVQRGPSFFRRGNFFPCRLWSLLLLLLLLLLGGRIHRCGRLLAIVWWIPSCGSHSPGKFHSDRLGSIPDQNRKMDADWTAASPHCVASIDAARQVGGNHPALSLAGPDHLEKRIVFAVIGGFLRFVIVIVIVVLVLAIRIVFVIVVIVIVACFRPRSPVGKGQEAGDVGMNSRPQWLVKGSTLRMWWHTRIAFLVRMVASCLSSKASFPAD